MPKRKTPKPKREAAHYKLTYRDFIIEIGDDGRGSLLSYTITGKTHPAKRRGLFGSSAGINELIIGCKKYVDLRLKSERDKMLKAIELIEEERRG